MIPLTDTMEQVERSGFGEQKAFTIEADAFMFQNLSKNLYSDPVRAVVREYGTNAWDANPKVPFEFHAPNKLEPWFSVRDYGPGLSETEVFTVFNSYGKSTKKGTNEAMGFFGLGAKSAFSVTKNWSVRSFQGGRVKTYDCYYGEDGKPKITLVADLETILPDGIEVRVPVKEHQFLAFSTNIREVYSHFSPQPKGNSTVELPYVERLKDILAKGEGWVIHGQAYSNQWLLKVGQVVYPLDFNHEVFNRHPLREVSVFLEAPVGSVSLAPSRESLHYDKETLEFLKTTLDKVASEASKSTLEEYNNLKTNFERYKYCRTLYEKNYQWYNLCSKQGENFLTVDDTKTMGYQSIHVGNTDAWSSFSILRQGTLRESKGNKYGNSRINPLVGIIVVLDSKVPAHLQRLKLTMQKHNTTGATLITDPSKAPEILEKLYDPPGVLYSSKGDLEELPKVSKSPGSKSKGDNLGVYKGYSFSKQQYYVPNVGNTYWKEKDVLINEGGTYVILKDRFYKGSQQEDNTLRRDKSLVEALSGRDYQLVGISTVSSSKFLKDKDAPGLLLKWTDFEDVIKEVLESTYSSISASTGYTREEILEVLSYCYSINSTVDRFATEVRPLLSKGNTSEQHKAIINRCLLLDKRDKIVVALGNSKRYDYLRELAKVRVPENQFFGLEVCEGKFPLLSLLIVEGNWSAKPEQLKEIADIINKVYG